MVRQLGFVRVGKIRGKRAESAEVGRAEADPRKIDVDCLKPSRVFEFNQNVFSLRPSIAEGIRIDPLKDTWSFHLRHYRV